MAQSNEQEGEELREQYRAIEDFVNDQVTGTENVTKLLYMVRHYAITARKQHELDASRRTAINAMAICLYWLEEDGRPKHLMQDMWDVQDISVLDHIDQKYIDEAEGHFKKEREAL